MNVKSIKSFIYKSIHAFASSDTYFRGLALNQTDYHLEVKDVDLEEAFGIKKIEIMISREEENDLGSCIDEFYLLSVDYYCTTKIISSYVDVYNLGFFGVVPKIHLIEVEKEHANKQEVLVIYNDFDKYSFEVDMTDVNLKLSLALNLNDMGTSGGLQKLKKIGLDSQDNELMFVYDWSKSMSSGQTTMLNLVYSLYNCSVTLYFYVRDFNKRTLLNILNVLNLSLLSTPKCMHRREIEIELEKPLDNIIWLYDKDIVQVLNKLYDKYDKICINTENTLFLYKSL